MLVGDFKFLNGLFRNCTLFQDQRNKVAIDKPKKKSRQCYLIIIKHIF